MRVESRTHQNELPAIFRQLFAIAPIDLWRRRSDELAGRERQNPFLGRYFDEKYSTERMLPQVLSYRKSTGRYPSIGGTRDHEIFKLYSFATALTRVYANLSSRAQGRLRGMVRDGLNRESGLAPVALEMAVATHLSNGGFDVDFVDLEGQQRFDFLARKEGIELEVDCKTVSGDVGRPVHRHRALELFHLIQSALAEQVNKCQSKAVRIIIPDSLHGSSEYMGRLSHLVLRSIREQRDLSAQGLGEVRLTDLDAANGAFGRAEEPSEDELAQIILNTFGTPDAHAISMHSPGIAAVVAVIGSRKTSGVVDGIYRPLKSSAKRQFTRRNPALLAVRLTDLTSPQLDQLALDESNGFGAICNRLFAKENRHHLYGVVFLAAPQPLTGFRFPGGQVFDERGTALLMRRDAHPYARDPRLNKLFSS
jgi:hypothetical protein